jgi:hypothetical protein
MSALITTETYALSSMAVADPTTIEPTIITVEPCQMVVFEVTDSDDFAKDWSAEQYYGLYPAAFVDAY